MIGYKGRLRLGHDLVASRQTSNMRFMGPDTENSNVVPDAILDRIKVVVGPKGYTTVPDEITPLCQSWRDNWSGWVPMVVRPINVEEVAAVIAICAETGTPVVPKAATRVLQVVVNLTIRVRKLFFQRLV